TYDVAGSQGPERIGAEGWRAPPPNPPPRGTPPRSRGGDPVGGEGKGGSPTRDYYLVEDLAGHRFWLYREGLYGRETAAARWFVQGLFA
ncbi:MAG: DNA polymerase Y family protein, partial [Xanthobacteraceae bacterium]